MTHKKHFFMFFLQTFPCKIQIHFFKNRSEFLKLKANLFFWLPLLGDLNVSFTCAGTITTEYSEPFLIPEVP